MGKKFDGSAFVDIRNYNKSTGFISFLLEPDQPQILANLPKDFLENSQIIFLPKQRHGLY